MNTAPQDMAPPGVVHYPGMICVAPPAAGTIPEIARPVPGKPARMNRPVGPSYRIRKPGGRGYLCACACGNMTDGRACTTCDTRAALHGTLHWCHLCRTEIDSRHRFCYRCDRIRRADRARRSRTARGLIRDVRAGTNRVGALVRVPPPSSPEIPPPEPVPTQSFRSPYRPTHRRGGCRHYKTRCGCGRVATGRSCRVHYLVERDARIIHFCGLCRTQIPSAMRRCGRCRSRSRLDAGRRRHILDGHVPDPLSWRSRTGALAPSGPDKTYPAGFNASEPTKERRPAAPAKPEGFVHRCSDPEWARIHGMGRLRFLDRNSTICRTCRKGFEYVSAIAKICPCCGREAD